MGNCVVLFGSIVEFDAMSIGCICLLTLYVFCKSHSVFCVDTIDYGRQIQIGRIIEMIALGPL